MTTGAVHQGSTQSAAGKLSAAEIANQLTRDELPAVAAVHDAPAGVAEIVVNGWTRGTREWAISYGVAEEGRHGDLRVTPLGYEVFAAAAERCPHPYADVSLADVTAEVRALVERVAAPATAQARVDRRSRRAGASISHRVSDAGFALAERIAGWFDHHAARH